jgi:hypothetical protein
MEKVRTIFQSTTWERLATGLEPLTENLKLRVLDGNPKKSRL